MIPKEGVVLALFLCTGTVLGFDVVRFRRASRPGEEKTKVRTLHVESRIMSRFATTHVRSEIENVDSKAREIFFIQQLPAEAFISNLTMKIDGRLEVAEVKGKEEARRDYDRAVASGNTAGLVAQKPRETDIFRTSVNVRGGGKVEFDLTYQEVLQRRHGVYKHIINVLSTKGVDDVKIDVFISERGKITTLKIPKFAPKIAVKTNKELLALPENSGAVTRSSEKDGVSTAHVSYVPATSTQGQLAVLYDVERSTEGGEIEVVDGYFVHFFAPKANFLDSVSADFVFVLDKSGSMDGRKFTQMQAAMKSILSQLKEEDRFSIVYFSSGVETWRKELQLANRLNKEEAEEFVDEKESGGGTNIHEALLEGIKILKDSQDPANERPSVVLFLTDGRATSGEITDAAGIKRAIKQSNDGANTKIHSLAFGDDADEVLLKQLSKENDGLFRKIFVASDAALQLDGFYSEISLPLFTDLDITYLNGSVDASSIIKNRDDDTLYEGSEVMVIGKLASPTATQLRGTVTAKSNDGAPVMFRCGNMCFDCCHRTCDRFCGPRPVGCFPPFPPPRPPIVRVPAAELPPNSLGGFIERMWAYQTIKKKLLEAELDSAKRTELRKEATRLAIQYNFVTELTSLVLVDKEAEVKPVITEEAEVADRFPAPSSGGARTFGSFGGRFGSLGRPAPRGLPGLPGPSGGFGPLAPPRPMRTMPPQVFATFTFAPTTRRTTTIPWTTTTTTAATLTTRCPLNILLIVDTRPVSQISTQYNRLVSEFMNLLGNNPNIDGVLSVATISGSSLQHWYKQHIRTGVTINDGTRLTTIQDMINDVQRRKGDSFIIVLSGPTVIPLEVKNPIWRLAGRSEVVGAIMGRDATTRAKVNEIFNIDSRRRPIANVSAQRLYNRVKC
jgi:uncharacterized protein YegL